MIISIAVYIMYIMMTLLEKEFKLEIMDLILTVSTFIAVYTTQKSFYIKK